MKSLDKAIRVLDDMETFNKCRFAINRAKSIEELQKVDKEITVFIGSSLSKYERNELAKLESAKYSSFIK